MGDAVDRALSENHAFISAILNHYSAGNTARAVELLERLQVNLEFIAAVAEHGIPLAPPPPAHHPPHHPIPQSLSSAIPTSLPPVPVFQHRLNPPINPIEHPQVSAVPQPTHDSQTPHLLPASVPPVSTIRPTPVLVPSTTAALLPRGHPAAVPLAPAGARPPLAGPSTSVPQPNRTIAPAPLPPRTSGTGSPD